MKEHIEPSSREITLAVMIEDLPAVEQVDALASTEGIDIVAVGPPDMSRALGASGTAMQAQVAEARALIA